MEHVIVRWEPSRGGYWLDAEAYRSYLPTLARDLPPGAREFALDPHHYDFASLRCVKDLWFRSFEMNDEEKAAQMCFGPNDSKHTEGLNFYYSRVRTVGVERHRDPVLGWLGSVLLDELMPTREGVVHELAMTGGLIRVVADDVTAVWR